MATTTRAHLHLGVRHPVPPPEDLGDYVWRELEDVMWELRRARHYARHDRPWTDTIGKPTTTTRAHAATELYRVSERLLVIAGRLRGFDFYARSTE